MVPLLSLFSDPHDTANVTTSQATVELGLQTMTEIMRFSPTGKKSVDAVTRIYEASKRLLADTVNMIEDNTASSSKKRSRLDFDHPTSTTSQRPRRSKHLQNDPATNHASTKISQPIPHYFPINTNASLLPPRAPINTNLYTQPDPQPSPEDLFYQPFNPTNFPQNSSTMNIDIETMWDSLNWSYGCDATDFPLDGPVTGAFWWDAIGDAGEVAGGYEAGMEEEDNRDGRMEGRFEDGEGMGYWGIVGGDDESVR
ncbi:putative c6 transcription factor [Phaeomoniella chlamydospora]|uniref:Putative c6 transcription factor n=1 Tax=Phaeomoniella chlamydospora TaxID=158046 RepID=A0A0G2GZQ6_PHACM|nr:putative c6 transcription factor [Phaeomoniella chlamydospora]